MNRVRGLRLWSGPSFAATRPFRDRRRAVFNFDRFPAKSQGIGNLRSSLPVLRANSVRSSSWATVGCRGHPITTASAITGEARPLPGSGRFPKSGFFSSPNSIGGDCPSRSITASGPRNCGQGASAVANPEQTKTEERGKPEGKRRRDRPSGQRELRKRRFGVGRDGKGWGGGIPLVWRVRMTLTWRVSLRFAILQRLRATLLRVATVIIVIGAAKIIDFSHGGCLANAIGSATF